MKVRMMPAMGSTTFRERASIIANTLGSKLEGLVLTCWAMLPTCVFTSSNSPLRFDMMPAVRMPLIQSAMALRTVSIQQSPSLAEVVDKGLEKIQEKNNVGQTNLEDFSINSFISFTDSNALSLFI